MPTLDQIAAAILNRWDGLDVHQRAACGVLAYSAFLAYSCGVGALLGVVLHFLGNH